MKLSLIWLSRLSLSQIIRALLVQLCVPFLSLLSLHKVVHRERVTLESQLELLRPVASTWPNTHSLSLSPSLSCVRGRAHITSFDLTLDSGFCLILWAYNSVTWQDTYFNWPNTLRRHNHCVRTTGNGFYLHRGAGRILGSLFCQKTLFLGWVCMFLFFQQNHANTTNC